MKQLLVVVMTSNAALFLFGALQHAGIALGPFHEPRIVPATVVETICGLALLWGTVEVFAHSSAYWSAALIANSIALAGVLLGMAALAASRGPRTASNDLYHHIMLALIGASIVILFVKRFALSRG